MVLYQKETLNHYQRYTYLAMQSVFFFFFFQAMASRCRHLHQKRQWLFRTNIVHATEPATKC